LECGDLSPLFLQKLRLTIAKEKALTSQRTPNLAMGAFGVRRLVAAFFCRKCELTIAKEKALTSQRTPNLAMGAFGVRRLVAAFFFAETAS